MDATSDATNLICKYMSVGNTSARTSLPPDNVVWFIIYQIISDIIVLIKRYPTVETKHSTSFQFRYSPIKRAVNCGLLSLRQGANDRIATQRYSSPEIPIGSRVMSRTTSEPSDGRSRKMVANVAGCRSFCTFRDCHTSIAFTPVGPQPNLAHIFGWIWD